MALEGLGQDNHDSRIVSKNRSQRYITYEIIFSGSCRHSFFVSVCKLNVKLKLVSFKLWMGP